MTFILLFSFCCRRHLTNLACWVEHLSNPVDLSNLKLCRCLSKPLSHSSRPSVLSLRDISQTSPELLPKPVRCKAKQRRPPSPSFYVKTPSSSDKNKKVPPLLHPRLSFEQQLLLTTCSSSYSLVFIYGLQLQHSKNGQAPLKCVCLR